MFKGLHNHDCQQNYVVDWLKPLECSPRISKLVDNKLLGGIKDSGKLHRMVQKELGADDLLEKLAKGEGNFECFEDLLNAYAATALTAQNIRNRARKMGIADPNRTNKEDHISLHNLVQKLRNEKGNRSPVRYYKAKGVSNADTSEEPKSDFTADDFLLVLQTEGQESMMVDNPLWLVVDATHNVTHYDYYLLSVVVIDRHGSGLVIGWGLTSRENHRTWYLTCSKFRPKCLKCRPTVLMTDDTNSSWNGMILVWKSLIHKLLCHWHFKKRVRERCCGIKFIKNVSGK